MAGLDLWAPKNVQLSVSRVYAPELLKKQLLLSADDLLIRPFGMIIVNARSIAFFHLYQLSYSADFELRAPAAIVTSDMLCHHRERKRLELPLQRKRLLLWRRRVSRKRT